MEPETTRNRTHLVPTEPGPVGLGAVFTPPGLAQRLVEGLAELVPGVRRYFDPSCGDGSLLSAALKAHADQPEIAEKGLFGIDIDPGSVEAARARICRQIGEPRSPYIDRHIVCDDSLRRPEDWPAACVVIANPPWVSFSGRRAATRQAEHARSHRGWPSLQGEFVECIARYVAANGTAARVLLPGSVTELERYGPLRTEVTRWTRVLHEPQELGAAAFRNVVEPAVLLTLVPSGGLDASSAASWTAPEPHARELAHALDRFPRLPHRSFADPGVHTGNSSTELIGDSPRPGWTRLRQGRDLAPFLLADGRCWVRTDLERTPGRRFRVATADHFRAFSVLLRQTADRPMAAVHEAPGYFRNSLLACRAVPGLDPYFITAILNGPVAIAWHRTRFRDARQRSFPQVKVAHLATQPFPISERAQAPELHDQLASLSRSAHSASTRTDSLLRELRVSALRAFRLPHAIETRLLELE